MGHGKSQAGSICSTLTQKITAFKITSSIKVVAVLQKNAKSCERNVILCFFLIEKTACVFCTYFACIRLS